jgi:hypothetical protein
VRLREVTAIATQRHFLLITIDTEGDNIWSRRPTVETRNAAFLPRFQALCEKFRLEPTYLTNYEMALSPALREMGLDILKRKVGEVGMHLHAWHSPPEYSLTGDDHIHHPYLFDYPAQIMRSKIAYLTDLLEETFGAKMVSHRAGRWSFNAEYARLSLERGYRVDCSVTPHVSWRWTPGDPRGVGGTDYSSYPDCAYFVDPEDISRPGRSALLEVPMTILPTRHVVRRLVQRVLPSRRLSESAVNRLFPVRWLRPTGKNLKDLLNIVDRAVLEKRSYIEYMLHSSELMPGGSPKFRTEESIELLYEHLEQLFEHATTFFQGATLARFYDISRERRHEPLREAA